MQERQRYSYIDNIKLAACILVALGHFFMSMRANSVIPESGLYNYFYSVVYTFHVPLFFVCSGFLYQKINRVSSFASYRKELPKKLLDLGVPYFIFTLATVLLKILFENEVTTKARFALSTLFIHPTAPYWYFYALFLLFLFIPCMKSKRNAAILFSASLILKAVVVFLLERGILQGLIYNKSTAISLVFSVIYYFSANAVWFCGGMLFAFSDEEKIRKAAKLPAALLLAAGLGVSIYLSLKNGEFSFAEDFIIGAMLVCFTALSAIIIAPDKLGKISYKLNEFFLPVFVLHTIGAAGVRILLFRLGIHSFAPHLMGGIIGSFVIPCVIYLIAKKITPLMFFFYPSKTIRLLKGKGNGQG